MALPVYPAGDLDRPGRLLAVLGSFWASTFAGGYEVESLAAARGQLDAQAQLDVAELVAAVSRFTVPVFHTENWYFLTLKESDRNQTPVDFARFDGTYQFVDPPQIYFGVATGHDAYSWLLPPGLVEAKLILNRVTGASVTLTEGVDYVLKGGVISFRDDPFANPAIACRNLFQDNVVVDREVGLWAYRGQFDLATAYLQFGYAVAIKAASSEGYKELLNAVYDALVEGTSCRSTEEAIAAMADVPVV